MSTQFQESLVATLVGVFGVYWTLRVLHPIWAPGVSRVLLKRGFVGMAMKIRFGSKAGAKK